MDFSAIADAGRANGFEVAGFATQAHAMASLGVDRELAALQEGLSEPAASGSRRPRQTLLMPGEMGERFKLLALTRGIAGRFRIQIPRFSGTLVAASL